MDSRLWSTDDDFLRASGYVVTNGHEDDRAPASLNWERVAHFVLNMKPSSRRSDQYKPHWKLWGYDLI